MCVLGSQCWAGSHRNERRGKALQSNVVNITRFSRARNACFLQRQLVLERLIVIS